MAFWKKDKKEKKEKKDKKTGTTPAEFKSVDAVETKKEETTGTQALPKEFGVLKGFYVSEKATMLIPFNQYVFKVFDNATKNEIKKQVEKSFNVKVGGVRTVNLSRKTRNLGRHTGYKKGFKKAIVALKEGYSIDQAKA